MDEHTNPSDPFHDDPAGNEPGPRSGGPGTAQQAPPPPPPSPPPRRLHRRRDGEVIGGVCAGLGDYFRIDPVVFRLAFVIAAFASGAGVIGYLIAWVIIPDEDGRTELGGEAGGEEPIGETPPWIWVALAVAAVIVLSGFTLQGGPSLLVAAGLVGLGILLVRRDTAQQHAQGTPVPRSTNLPPEPAPAGSWGATAASARPPSPPPGPAPETGSSPLVRLVLGLAVVAVGGMLALQAGTSASFLPVAWTAVPLAIVGGGLVVGAVLGGARALIGWGIALLVALLVTLGGVALLPGFDGTTSGGRAMALGEISERPLTADALQDSYSVGLGSLELDLRALSAEELAEVDLTGNVGIGSLTILVGPEVAIDARGQVGIGQVDLLEEGASGGVAPRRVLLDPPGASEALALDLRTGIGEIVVARR